ncbi:peptidase [cf. Phormidesmis sp. LEGE 11477]|uniref:ABC transporter permease/M1 family aminopeptidase n=1 Tax=cf. Phormidesmis sp. LEGE 11477 TaxID=1828680 RepID=UPI00187ED289|nr:peptidase [cf. Phormidesmis sp. LEGE 11477]MBE9063517.1 peptidase [cf. Phormidesmis sp. LEGE 11477]
MLRSPFSPSILAFEIRYHLRRPTFWLIAGLFLTIGLVDIVSKAEQGNAFFFVNSPSQIFQTTLWYSIFGILAASAFVAETFVRDANYRMDSLILSTPIRKWDYLATRFAAAFGTTVLAFSAYIPGMIIGTLMPGLNAYALGPFRADGYLASYGLIALPNVFLVSAIAFTLAARTRSLAITFAGSIALVMLYLASLMMTGADTINYQQYPFWAMVDPFGFYAFEWNTLSWTVFEHNTLMPSVGGLLIWNRLLWLAIALTLWITSYRAYRMQLLPSGKASPEGSLASVFQVFTFLSPHPKSLSPERGTLSPVPFSLGRRARDEGSAVTFFYQLIYRSAFEIRTILQGRAFWLLTGFGLLSLIMAAIGAGSFNYSNPSTDILIHSANVYLDYILFAIIVVYSAELFWRDRTLRLQSVIDATPVSNAVLLFSKLLALFAIITFNLLLAIAVFTLYQLLNGYTQFNFPLYFQMLFGEHGPYFYLTAVLALSSQVITRQKYAGMGLVVLISLSYIPLDALGLYHNLYRWAATNDIEYSPMNGYGHLFTGHLWYSLYWGIVSAILMAIAYILWPRGVQKGLKTKRRWQKGWKLGSRSIKRTIVALLVAWFAVGSWIFYNTTIVNAYQPPGKEQTAAEIEQRFKQYENLPMPVVTATTLNVELYPDQRYFEANGEYTLENRTDTPIEEIHLITFINLDLAEVAYPGATLREAHPDWGYYIYDLAEPLLPDAQQTMGFTTQTNPIKGFQNQVNSDDVYMVYPNDVVDNGTNLYSPFILPFVGYTKMVEHKKAWLRDKLDLPPLAQRLRPHDDPTGLAQAMMLTHLVWGTTDITVGTASDQTAVSAGELVDTWQENGRSYFRYRSDEQSRGKFTLYSGRYATYRNEDYRVPIEIYYYPQHDDNIELITTEIGQALEFYEETFGPYPFENVRAVEFVYYDGMIFSEGGTLGIPEVLVWKSEAQGLGQESIANWISYLLAQSWWEDQLIAADVAGGMTIREALSEYASQLYQRSQRSPAQQTLFQQQRMRDFFRSLGKIDFQEPPLTDIYNELPIARHKGSMILELIEAQIGQEAVLAGIRDFLATYRYQGPPYATVIDLQDALTAQAASDAEAQIVRDLFTQVLTFQVGIAEATYTPLPDGSYDIRLEIEAQRFRTSGLGQQEILPLDLPVKIALTDERDRPLKTITPTLSDAQTTLTLTTAELPAYASVDPDFKLPSAYTQDNRKRLRPSSLAAQ